MFCYSRRASERAVKPVRLQNKKRLQKMYEILKRRKDNKDNKNKKMVDKVVSPCYINTSNSSYY